VPFRAALSSRRSGRLAGHDAVTYNEDVLAAVDGGVLDSSKCERAMRGPLSGQWGNAQARPEVYNDEHVSALGAAKEEWTLFVDGYCPNTGKRVRPHVLSTILVPHFPLAIWKSVTLTLAAA
jgi:hypothetical protein